MILLANVLAIFLLAHFGYGALAAALVGAEMFFSSLRKDRRHKPVVEVSAPLIFGLSVVALISLTVPPLGQPVFPLVSQLALAAGYGFFVIYRDKVEASFRLGLILVGLNQILAVSAIFLSAAYWELPNLIVVAATWAVSFLNAWWVLIQRGERSAKILAASWALIAAQIAWVLQSWQVNYIIAGGYIIVPQASIIILGVGYCMLSIYTAHSAKRLSRRRLVEYVSIAGVILAIIIAGTHWNGTG